VTATVLALQDVRKRYSDGYVLDVPSLDVRASEVLAIIGPNGSGKSALLDSLTWALWGRARGCEGGQHQDRIIRDGASRARVRVTFREGALRYRVTRSRDRRGRGDVRLEVGVEGVALLAELSGGARTCRNKPEHLHRMRHGYVLECPRRQYPDTWTGYVL